MQINSKCVVWRYFIFGNVYENNFSTICNKINDDISMPKTDFEN